MKARAVAARNIELRRLLSLSERVGRDPLLTQASTGNSSAKLEGGLWIKASGKWMADAVRDDIFIRLDLEEVRECLRRKEDPAGRYRGASLETAMHAVLPHRIVVHVHCVNTIAWAVRLDGAFQLENHLDGLRWHWIPYVPSGLPLSREIARALSAPADTELFVLGNHGLVLCGEDAEAVEELLAEVRQRLSIQPRKPPAADYASLREISMDSPWQLPDDDRVHALGTDPISRATLSEGVLYPCQAIFSDSGAPELFRPICCPVSRDGWECRYRNRPFLIIEGRGVLVSRSIAPAELAMLSGLAEVVQRLSPAAPLRYLTEIELGGIAPEAAQCYRELSSSRQVSRGR
ncbi:MAG TPA: class II aldolase/adducin family protein [Bryobacteraceae bacterium]|jgi:rhamnose utilization protein RhaD (predicted bifunctional aldolase and dehydrogenase)